MEKADIARCGLGHERELRRGHNPRHWHNIRHRRVCCTCMSCRKSLAAVILCHVLIQNWYNNYYTQTNDSKRWKHEMWMVHLILMATADRNICGLTCSMARGIESYLMATDSRTWCPGLVPVVQHAMCDMPTGLFELAWLTVTVLCLHVCVYILRCYAQSHSEESCIQLLQVLHMHSLRLALQYHAFV